MRRYLEHREYDPEGLVYNGEALAVPGQAGEARRASEKALSSVASVPRQRRGSCGGGQAGLRVGCEWSESSWLPSANETRTFLLKRLSPWGDNEARVHRGMSSANGREE